MMIMGGVTRRPYSLERSIKVRTVKFTRARNRNGDTVHAIEGAYLRWLSGAFEETGVVTYSTKCAIAKPMVEPVPMPDRARVTCTRCRSAMAREKEARGE